MACVPRVRRGVIVGKLIVGRAAHDGAVQCRDRPACQHAAERARREHVTLLGDGVVSPNDRNPTASRARPIDVGNLYRRAFVDEEPRQMRADVARALHDHTATTQVGRSERDLAGRARFRAIHRTQ